MKSKSIKKIIPIILAGGSGTRLWPLSRKSFPKQFLNLLDDEFTLLQKTYKRIENLNYVDRPIVVCNEDHRFIVAHQMKEINIEPLEILLEPEGRNTTSAIALTPPPSKDKINLVFFGELKYSKNLRILKFNYFLERFYSKVDLDE